MALGCVYWTARECRCRSQQRQFHKVFRARAVGKPVVAGVDYERTVEEKILSRRRPGLDNVLRNSVRSLIGCAALAVMGNEGIV